MSALLDFFAAGPARIQALLVAFLAAVALGLGLTTWALVERLGAVQARAERDRALDQVAVVSAAAKACSVGVDEAKKVGKAAIDATKVLQAAAERISAPAVHTFERTEKIIERPMTVLQAADCNWGWSEVESLPRPTVRAP